MSVDADIAGIRSLVGQIQGQANSIIRTYPAGSDAASAANLILNMASAIGSSLDGLLGDLASQNAGASASDRAALTACQQQISTLRQQLAQAQSNAGAALAPTAPTTSSTASGVSTGAAVTMTLGGSLIGGIIGWAARGYSMRGAKT